MTIRSLAALAAWMVVVLGGLAVRGVEPKVIAEGEWSKPVADVRGYAVRGRLVLCEKQIAADRREAAIYIELQDASEHVGGSVQLFCDLGKTDFRPEYKSGLSCELRDKENRPVPLAPFPFSGAVPRSVWMPLPSDGTVRLRASPFGVHRPGALAISLPSQLWVIGGDDPGDYFLTGVFTVDPAADRTPPSEDHVWRGTLELPAVRIASGRK